MNKNIYDIWLSEAINFQSRNVLDFFKSVYEVFNMEIEYSSQFIYDNRDEISKKVGFLKEAEKKHLKEYNIKNAEIIFEKCNKNNIDVVAFNEKQYPKKLKEIYNFPLVLFRKGRYVNIDDNLSLGIVGTRTASNYAIRATSLIAEDLSIAGSIIVSGQALGVDTAAHKAALSRNGYTVAFAGCGLDVDYPKGNYDVRKSILENGVLYSEYPPETHPYGSHFPVRNRLISGFCDGIFVTEGKSTSGSLHTANHALEQGRDVFALPGDIFSAKAEATFRLIKEGAIPVMSALDILGHYLVKYGEQMNFIGVRKNYHGGYGGINIPLDKNHIKSDRKKNGKLLQKEENVVKNELSSKNASKINPVKNDKNINMFYFTKKEKEIYYYIKDKKRHIDEITSYSSLNLGEILSTLTRLEIEGFLKAQPGKNYEVV